MDKWNMGAFLGFLMLIVAGVYYALGTSLYEQRRPYCDKTFDQVHCVNSHLDSDLYKVCLSALADMRGGGGGNYTTHDDEDLDGAIKACASTAKVWSPVCSANPKLIAQQELCK